MVRTEVVVMGASAGGVEALSRIVAALPADFPAAVAVVLHLPPAAPSLLPQILARAGCLPAAHPVDGVPLEPGQIYVAPPDRHLQFGAGRLHLTRGPRENGHRPAIDVLFRSAARAYGPRVTGVVLTGADDDGTEGLLMITAHGGHALVQEPSEALFDRMPRSAIGAVPVDAVLPLDSLGAMLVQLARRAGDDAYVEVGGATVARQPHPEEERQQLDLAIARWQEGEPVEDASGFTCPLCGGGIWQGREGPLVRFRCHTGHAFSPESFANGHGELLEATLWHALRLLSERCALLRRFAQSPPLAGQGTGAAVRYAEQAAELEEGIALLRGLLQQNGFQLSAPDG